MGGDRATDTTQQPRYDRGDPHGQNDLHVQSDLHGQSDLHVQSDLHGQSDGDHRNLTAAGRLSTDRGHREHHWAGRYACGRGRWMLPGLFCIAEPRLMGS
jgi:hypothetical protein